MRKRAPVKHVKSGNTMDRIATVTDILGELSLTEKGNSCISQSFPSFFPKWTESFAMPNKEASTVAHPNIKLRFLASVFVRYNIMNYMNKIGELQLKLQDLTNNIYTFKCFPLYIHCAIHCYVCITSLWAKRSKQRTINVGHYFFYMVKLTDLC